MGAVVFSSGSRETSAVDKEFLATEDNMKSASIIFSSLEALAYTNWRDKFWNTPAEYVPCSLHAVKMVCFTFYIKVSY